MTKLVGSIIDKVTGEPVETKVQVLTAGGKFIHPNNAILKIGSGSPFFYSNGNFEIDVPRGKTRLTIERGTEYIPQNINVDVPAHGVVDLDINIERWSILADQGWHPGNTHIHYDENEHRPDERLQLDPRIEDLRMTAVSILKRWDLEYASNKYTPGVLTDFSSTDYYVQCGEENRHNAGGSHEIGYGHVMFLSIQNMVEPVSRGALVDAFDPDYPPLCYACDDAHRQGGIVIWCHNGMGMELPVAAALGKVDAFNLFDAYWMDPEYDIYYQILNTGLKLPVSTGSDWFISSGNRVYVDTGGAFDYEDWVDALKKGRSFITNGPAIYISVNGNGPGSEIDTRPGESLSAIIKWESHYPVTCVELVVNGDIFTKKTFPEGSKNGQIEIDVPVGSNAWIAARLSSEFRDSYFHPIFAHTSPVYINAGLVSPVTKPAAKDLNVAIENSMNWVQTKGKFYTDQQRREVVDIFRQGQNVYRGMLK